MQRSIDTELLFAELAGGDRAALGRAITLVESTREADRELAEALVQRCLAKRSNALRIGITGVPGVGKSTLIDTLGMSFLEAGHRVAVLAVDPSSSRSSGSILGDKTRMEKLGGHAQAFIRPSPAAGALGGVARRTRETILLCEAAGYDRVLVETVGVGQSELDVDHMTDLNLLLMLAGAGDELQGIKRGIMEAADILVLTKASGENLARAQRAQRDLRNAIMFLPPRDSGRYPEVLLTSALEGSGMDALLQRVEALHAQDLGNGRLDRRRSEQDLHWFQHAVNEGLLHRFRADARVAESIPAFQQAVKEGRTSPFQAAKELIDRFFAKDSE